ncbi:hypothetical protein MMC14_010708 [Varicellaria rhodocarpa]|nr:hypothetical protein [Varicellaria rhodocarpa]
MADLEEAIQVGQEAVDTTPQDHPNRAVRLNNLGGGLGNRYSRTGAIADLEEAIQVGREAVDATPQDHSDRARYLNNLGVRLCDRYLRTGAMADLEEAILCCQSALSQPSSPTNVRIITGRRVLDACAIISEWQKAVQASEITINLIPKLTSRSLENSDKQHILGQVVGLASDAAAAALHAGKEPLVALNFLEQGRGVLATSLQEMRMDILDLQRRYPKLAEQFNHLRDELELLPVDSSSVIDEGHRLTWQSQTDRRYKAGNKFDELVIEIRKQHGFEDFLLAPNETEMQSAARSGPIVVVNISKHRCDAIMIERDGIQALALPDLHIEEINSKARESDLGRPNILEWLWDAVTSPILDALGFNQPLSGDYWPHVWWIPTGPLTKFPLHAAGRHRKGSSETVLDRVMSSYSSSIKTIIHGRRRRDILSTSAQSSTSAKALLVAMKYTGKLELPSTHEEVSMLHELCKSMALTPIEPGQRKQDIVPHLPQCRIFHFAGHGYTDIEDPSKSHLLLNDGKNDSLTIANLLEMNIRQSSPFLAYLSACGTGQIANERFFDESIHLISSFQLAGFRHVIGTLWEVNDKLCIDMAKITYEGMKDGCMTDESVCRGLHNATKKLRDRWLDMLTETKCGRRPVRQAGKPLTKRARNNKNEDQRDGRPARDASMSDEDEKTESIHRIPLHWVPYVHFGV